VPAVLRLSLKSRRPQFCRPWCDPKFAAEADGILGSLCSYQGTGYNNQT
jgi:hypothetical protein